MKRLAVALLALALLAAPLAAKAQPAGKIPRVGVLRPGDPPPGDFGQREAFEGGLRELGWTPGTSILIEYRYAEGKPERLPQLAAELVQLPVDVIVASATVGVRAAQQATRTIPIVMSTLPDPLREGFIASLARPGGNTTGLTLDAEDLAGKQLELLKDTVPTLSRRCSAQRQRAVRRRAAAARDRGAYAQARREGISGEPCQGPRPHIRRHEPGGRGRNPRSP